MLLKKELKETHETRIIRKHHPSGPDRQQNDTGTACRVGTNYANAPKTHRK